MTLRLMLRPARMGLIVATVAFRMRPPAIDAQASAALAIDRFMTRAAGYGQFNGAILVADGGRIPYQRAFGLANMEHHARINGDISHRSRNRKSVKTNQ